MYLQYLCFMGTFFSILFNTRLYCFAGCLGTIVWTNAVLGVSYACVLYFCICTCSAQMSMFHLEKRSRNKLIVITIIIIIIIIILLLLLLLLYPA